MNLGGRIDTAGCTERTPARCRAKPLPAPARGPGSKGGVAPYTGTFMHCEFVIMLSAYLTKKEPRSCLQSLSQRSSN